MSYWIGLIKKHVNLFHDLNHVENADCVVTDTWVSMGTDAKNQHNLLAPFQVNKKLMEGLPHRKQFSYIVYLHTGEEVTAEVIDGSQSLVWDEAENRLHAQKAVLLWCMT